MIESKSVRKRSVGRPKTNKALQKLRVQTWFNAVAEASGKTAYELEKEFAPSTVDREDFNKQRARLWEKYRLGKTMPTIKDKKGGKKGTAQLVEEKYPDTLEVLQDPIWILADANIQMGMDDLKVIYLTLEDEIKSLLLEDGDLTEVLFWRKPCDNYQQLLDMIIEQPSPGALKALLCLLRESIICLQKNQYAKTLSNLKTLSLTKSMNTESIKLAKIAYKDFNTSWHLS
jgi:hypothetical protein